MMSRKARKRRKTRVREIIHDPDRWLLDHANAIDLHQLERWDLMERGCQKDEEHPPENRTMKRSPRTLRLNIDEIEMAFESLPSEEAAFHVELYWTFLDLATGRIVGVESEEELEELALQEDKLELPLDLFEGLFEWVLDDFVAFLPEELASGKLKQAIRGKGALRRFKNIVYNDIELKHHWHWFEIRRKRERIIEWLKDHQIEPDWGGDILKAPPLPDKRDDLLRAVAGFLSDARRLTGVRRIALLGSLTTDKTIPKDVDLLVEVDDVMPLGKLAQFKRQLLGKTMQTGDSCGADVFLCNSKGEYLGRICSWKKCAAGMHRDCEARHCGRRPYLSDDLQNLRLEPSLISEPPLELWPEVVARVDLPDDVKRKFVVG